MRGLNKAHAKIGKSIFKRRFSMSLYGDRKPSHPLWRSSLPEDTLKIHYVCSTIQRKGLLLKSSDFIQFSWQMNACSPYLDLIETSMLLKSQLQTFCRMNNIQHTLLINVTSITAIYLFFHCFFFFFLSYFSSKKHCVLLLIVIKKKKKESNQLQFSVNLYG